MHGCNATQLLQQVIGQWFGDTDDCHRLILVIGRTDFHPGDIDIGVAQYRTDSRYHARFVIMARNQQCTFGHDFNIELVNGNEARMVTAQQDAGQRNALVRVCPVTLISDR